MQLDKRLRRHVEELAGRIGERNLFKQGSLDAAAAYIEAEWRQQGYDVERQVYECRGVSCANLEIRCPGESRPDEVLVVGAHYDTVRGSPGADDNASGVAALLEISRALTQRPRDRSVRLVAFVNEETPFFFTREMGSHVYAHEARKRGDAIVLMISLEMLGYYTSAPGSQRYPPLFKYFFPDRGSFVAFVSNLRSRGVLRKAVAAFRAHSDFPVEHLSTFWLVPGVSWSDQVSFWRQGYPAIMVTDTAFYRNDAYHSPRDTPQRLDYVGLGRVTEGLVGSIRSLATARPAV